MSPNLSLICDGKKFMWDGRVYATREDLSLQGEAYQKDHFEVRVVEQDGQFFVYTRRVVKEVVVTPQ